MNNSNDPPKDNTQPGSSGGGNQWNYVGLAAMWGAAAFHWIWNRRSEREIQKVKDQHEKEVSTLKSKMVTQEQKLASQSHQLMKEREALEEEKQRIVKSAGAVLHKALEQEDNWYQRATATLKELEGQLMDRQHIYCSYIKPQAQRRKMEQNMLLKVARDPILAELNLESDLKDIFKRDKHCAEKRNTDKRKNGRLMWVYLEYWQLQVNIQKHKKANEAILRGNIK